MDIIINKRDKFITITPIRVIYLTPILLPNFTPIVIKQYCTKIINDIKIEIWLGDKSEFPLWNKYEKK